MRHIQVSDVDGKMAVCFDTGLDPRSFARTKMSQSLIEPGYIVTPDGTKETWKAAGVNEMGDGFMRVWGKLFTGERLDLLLGKASFTDKSAQAQQAALQAVAYWIRGKMLLGETHSALNPGAAFAACTDNEASGYAKGSIFFAPESLSQRCLLMEGIEKDRYNCPDLKDDMEAAAFCAGTMLYEVLAKTHPYPDKETIYQDMREGIFMPSNAAIPGLDKKLSDLIQAALLLPVINKKTFVKATNILSGMLDILMNKEGEIAKVPSLFHTVSEEENKQIVKDKKLYSLKQNVVVRAQRFYVRNKIQVWIVGIISFFVIFVTISMIQGRNERATTAGMSPETVVYEYYEAFSTLNHIFMEACVMGADKSDINVAMNFFVITRVRQNYEGANNPSITSARVWKDLGRELPAPNVFGVTDLSVKQTGGNEFEGVVYFRTDYILWFPHEEEPSHRTDDLTLKIHKGNWFITEINRTIH
jgi:hypothetical protein